MARRAKATATLLEQVNEAAPSRSKSSDGWIGDSAHAASKSDHNPNQAGVVQAQDVTHDPHGGFDSYKFAEHLRLKRDKRIKYVISNRKIFAGNVGPQPWEWRGYTGKNPHDQHVHVSVGDSAAVYDDGSPWDIGFTSACQIPCAARNPADLAQGLERVPCLHAPDLSRNDREGRGWGFGEGTEQALMQFQRTSKLDADGICGIYSWRELLRPWAKETGILPADPRAKLTSMALVAQESGSTLSVEELLAAFLVILEDILPPGFMLTKPEEPPPTEELPEAPAEEPKTEFHAVLEGGYFSDDPYDKKTPTSIRCNNPGAINTTKHVATLPGYNGASETSTGNKTAIFWAPEYGCLCYHDLLKRYLYAGAVTIRQIIKRYGGGQDYSAYEKFVVKYTGLPATYEIKIDGSDDAALLSFAKAMFRYEAGRETPLSDPQIMLGFEMAREREAMA